MPVRWAKGVEFTLTSLSEKDDQGRSLVPAQNFHAITHRHDLLHEFADMDELSGKPRSLVPSWDGGWCLVDELPDTDELSGIPMSATTFASRWQGDPSEVLKHLMNKHDGGVG